jgi:hypothetical protein
MMQSPELRVVKFLGARGCWVDATSGYRRMSSWADRPSKVRAPRSTRQARFGVDGASVVTELRWRSVHRCSSYGANKAY